MNVIKRHKITVINRNDSFDLLAGELLLAGMERACHSSIRVGCRGGGCGLCKIRVLEGAYQTRRMSSLHITDEEKAAGFALACRVVPSSDLSIESDHFNQTVS
jgi:ferredoxin